MDEFELIRRYFSREADAPGVIAGVGDDGAVLSPREGYDQVSVIDTIVAGVHFPADTDAEYVGHRAVAVNLSDIAAMGAEPRWMTLALTLAGVDEDWLQGFADGLYAVAAEYGVALVGGDTTRGGQIVVSVQMSGEVPNGKAVYRSGARPGDTVFVTGTLGDAAGGLRCVEDGIADEFLTQRFLRPTPRVDAGRRLAGRATAAIDVSDGLAADLSHVLAASRVGAEIDVARLPLSAALERRFGRDQAVRFALGGGDDYELCFTAADQALAGSLPGGATAIGKITDSGGLVCRDGDTVVDPAEIGYRHFR